MSALSLIDQEILKFKQDLANFTSIEIVQKRITFGDCLMLDNHTYHSLRSKIAKHFSVNPNEVLVVGSAKLGFSIAPTKKYRHFSDKSDIDVVIVSSSLFDSFWKAVYHLWKEKVLWDNEQDFKNYLFQGWIRPDKLPMSKKFKKTSEWWEFFRSLTASNNYGPYKISGAIYKDWDYLEGYQNTAVQSCKDLLL